jgi:hypothetical protein
MRHQVDAGVAGREAGQLDLPAPVLLTLAQFPEVTVAAENADEHQKTAYGAGDEAAEVREKNRVGGGESNGETHPTEQEPGKSRPFAFQEGADTSHRHRPTA